jgi:enoyl-CoA hydratase/carnithine racemase
MLLAAQVFEAPMLLQRGFLQQVLTGAALVAEVASLSQRMSALAPQAARMNKATFRALAEQGAAALPALVQTAYDYADTPEHREGVSAFMQKRPARFS